MNCSVALMCKIVYVANYSVGLTHWRRKDILWNFAYTINLTYDINNIRCHNPKILEDGFIKKKNLKEFFSKIINK